MPARKRIGVYPAGPMHWFDQVSGSWRLVYERIPGPQDEVDQFVYMTLQLAMNNPMGGAGVPYRNNLGAFSPGLLSNPMAPNQGVPTPSGSFDPMPLIGGR